MPNRNGLGNINKKRNFAGSSICTCPNCGFEKPHKRGIPCSQEICPKCKKPMRGVNCL